MQKVSNYFHGSYSPRPCEGTTSCKDRKSLHPTSRDCFFLSLEVSDSTIESNHTIIFLLFKKRKLAHSYLRVWFCVFTLLERLKTQGTLPVIV